MTETADLDAELVPYRALIKEGLADSVMTAHVFNKGLDPWDPATLSRYTVNRILRGRFGYKGVIVSDDLLMGAITRHYGLEEAAAKALNAGVDVLLISGNTPKGEVYAAERVVLAINRAITTAALAQARARRDRSRRRAARPPAALAASPGRRRGRPVSARVVLTRLGGDPSGGAGGLSPRDTLTRNRRRPLATGHETTLGGFGDAQKMRSRGERLPTPPSTLESTSPTREET